MFSASKHSLSLLVSIVLWNGPLALSATEPLLQSPDGRLTLRTQLDQGVLHYELDRDGAPLLKSSRTGLHWGDRSLVWKDASLTKSSHRSTWKPIWGKRQSIENHYHEAVLDLQPEKDGPISMTIVFRLYDEGLAFRYRLQQAPSASNNSTALTVCADLTEFNFAHHGTAWSYNGERENKGPEALLGITQVRQLPMTIQFGKTSYATLAEAHLEDFSWIDLQPQEGDLCFQASLQASHIKLPFQTPWRVLLVGDTPGDLVDASLLENLNPPCAIEDPSWISPGITFWDWRTWGYKAPDGFEYGLDMLSWRRFIDFASQKGIPYLLLDANWYGPEFDSANDPKVSRDHVLKQLENGEIVREPAPKDWKNPINIPALIKYGQERQVGIFLYINDKARIRYDFEETLATYQQWGAAGIKYGFMEARNRQEKVNKTNEIIQLCAKYQLMCNFHDGPVPPNGDYRTWPNCTTREFCHAQADAKRSFVPSTFNTSIFVNMITGPIDMGNGMFALNHGHKVRPRVFQPIPSTIVGECARTLITFSGQSIMLDAPESYAAHPALFSFLAAQKQPWKSSQTLDGDIGKFIVMTRTAQDGTILLGATTNEDARQLTVPLHFLPEGTYKAIVLEDAPDTHYLSSRETYQMKEHLVTKNSSLTLRLAPGGGACIKLQRQ